MTRSGSVEPTRAQVCSDRVIRSARYLGGTVEPQPLSAPAIRGLLVRRDLATVRHRAALGRALGVSDSEMLAIAHLAHHGELMPSRLAELLGLSSGGTTAMIQRLEQSGHLAREPHPSDGRSFLVRLTPATAERVAGWDAAAIEELAGFAARFSGAEHRAVVEFLTRAAELSEAVDDSEEEPALDPVPCLWG
jgi:DNA-binding MarR family transcriptional regulator